MPMPSYNSEDDLEVFMTWIHSLMCFYSIHQFVGPEHNHNRTTILHAALKDRAQTWYNMTIQTGICSLHAFPPAFLTILLKLADMFVTPAAVMKAQCSFNQVTYTKDKGIRAYVHKLQMISKHFLLLIDKHTLQKQIVEVIPSMIWNSLINLKGLSTSMSSVTEWVEAIAWHEFEKATFNDTFTNPTRFGMATMRQPTWVTIPANCPTSNQSKQNSSDAQSNKHAKPLGPMVQPWKPIPLAEITCHACSKKGHYHGSKECLKTPSSAWIHALGFGAELREETSPDRHDEEEEIPFEFEGDANIEFADYESDNNTGSGAIVTNFHITSKSSNEVDIAQVAQLATTGKMEHNQKIANKLVSSIKEQYETWGSGIKAPFHGPSAKQLKATEQQTWASNVNLKPNMTKGPHQKVQVGCCPTAVLKANGVDAFICFDLGSELDAISPDFAQAVGIKPTAKDASIKICLATKGSTSTTLYKVEVNIDLGKATLEHPLEVLNLDHWDVILGCYFCNRYNVRIDYENKVIHIGEIMIKTLSKDDEVSMSRKLHGAQKSSSEPKVTTITVDNWLDGPLDEELPFLTEKGTHPNTEWKECYITLVHQLITVGTWRISNWYAKQYPSPLYIQNIPTLYPNIADP
jgi:hypothetical protein